MSLNAQGMSNQLKQRKIFKRLHNLCTDIVFVQEAHCVSKSNSIWKSEWGQQVIFSNGDSNARGVMTLVSKHLHGCIKEIRCDSYGRYLICKAEINSESYCLANIYAPNEDEPAFFRSVFDDFTEMECMHIIIGGDFNLVLQPEDRSSGKLLNSNASNVVTNFAEQENLVDIWRMQHPDSKMFTWNRVDQIRGKLNWSRIDFFLLSSSLCNKTTKTDILPSYLSDHSMIECAIQVTDTKRGPGYWKINNSFLNNEKYCKMIGETIDKTLGMFSYLDPSRLWEILKFELANVSKEFAQEESQKTKENKHNLYKLLCEM